MKPYEKYKESGVAWIGEVPEHWANFRLKTLIPTACNGVWGDDEKKDDNDIICIRVADFDMDNLGVSKKNLTIRNIESKQLDTRLLVGGELLIEKSGGGEKQTVGRVIQNSLKVRAVCSNFVAALKNTTQIENRFLAYFFHALYSNKINTKSIKQTTGIQNLDLDNYLEERIFLPLPAEQTAIARYLDQKTGEIDQLIAQKERLLALWEEEKTALINQAVTRGLDAGAKMKDSGVAWIGDVPEDWEVKRLKYVADNLNYKRIPLSSEQRSGIEKIYDYYGASGVIDQVDDFLFDGDFILVGEDGANLITRSVPLAFKASGKFWVNNHAHILQPKNGNIEFFTYYLESIDYSIWISGSAQPKLTSENLMNIHVLFPPLPEQTAIVRHIETQTARIQQQMDQTRKLIELLKEFRATLISEVVTGKVKITE